MSSFAKKLEQLVQTGEERGLIGAETAANLLRLAEEQAGHGRVLSLAAILAWLGGGIGVFGVILLVSANWDAIGQWGKVCGFLVLFLSAHAGGLWLRVRQPPLPKTAEGLNFLGAGLFLAGVALIAQMYHLNVRPPNYVLYWMAAVIPLAILLRSPAITLMSVFATLVWIHMEGSFTGSPLLMSEFGITPHLIVEMGLGIALIGFAGMVRRWDRSIASVLLGCGIVLLSVNVYLFGFLRHFSEDIRAGTAWFPAIALLSGAVGLAAGAAHLAPDVPRRRNRLIALLAALLAWGALALAVEWGAVPRGPNLTFFNFGWDVTYDTASWVLTVVAWVLWFVLALWCISYGAYADKSRYVSLGVVGFGLGIMTRFFDLVGSLAQTGTVFLLGGVVLLVTGFVMERWRRQIVTQRGAIG